MLTTSRSSYTTLRDVTLRRWRDLMRPYTKIGLGMTLLLLIVGTGTAWAATRMRTLVFVSGGVVHACVRKQYPHYVTLVQPGHR